MPPIEDTRETNLTHGSHPVRYAVKAGRIDCPAIHARTPARPRTEAEEEGARRRFRLPDNVAILCRADSGEPTQIARRRDPLRPESARGTVAILQVASRARPGIRHHIRHRAAQEISVEGSRGPHGTAHRAGSALRRAGRPVDGPAPPTPAPLRRDLTELTILSAAAADTSPILFAGPPAGQNDVQRHACHTGVVVCLHPRPVQRRRHEKAPGLRRLRRSGALEMS